MHLHPTCFMASRVRNVIKRENCGIIGSLLNPFHIAHGTGRSATEDWSLKLSRARMVFPLIVSEIVHNWSWRRTLKPARSNIYFVPSHISTKRYVFATDCNGKRMARFTTLHAYPATGLQIMLPYAVSWVHHVSLSRFHYSQLAITIPNAVLDICLNLRLHPVKCTCRLTDERKLSPHTT